MAGVQAVAALADDEHGHYEADDYSSPRGTLSERARADPMSPGFARMMDVTCAMFERMNMRLFSSAGRC
jgi:hypothetical protein